MKNRLIRLLSFILLLAGMSMILYPNVRSTLSKYENNKIIAEVEKKRVAKEQAAENPEAGEESEKPYDLLYRDMCSYNQEIHENKQEGLKDAWSYQQPVFKLEDYGVVEDAVGYLTIDAMDIRLPLFLGAVNENLSQGAAVLGQTSMPIGGENTNCVIAAHRGWKGIPMFVDIEKLRVGDSVVLDNLWGTLYYQVAKIRVISPDEIDAVKIQEGRDLLTLITCHPYRQHYQRYVVYCERVTGESGSSQDTGEKISAEETEEQISQQEQTIPSSQKAIEQERFLNKGGLIVVGGALILYLLSFLFRKRKSRKK